MNNNNYESMRAFLVSGLFVCTCAVAQAQSPTDAANQLNSSVGRSSAQQILVDTEIPPPLDTLDVAQYGHLVQTLESEFGPFDARLSEPLLATGSMLAEAGDYHGAVRVMERALHVMRVNQGLYSEPQIAVVERLVEFNAALEDWEAVDENFRYLEFLYRRLFDQGGLRWDHGIAQVADWHVIAINKNLGDDRDEHLRQANKLFKQRLAYAEQDESVDQHVIDVLRHNVEYTAYHLQRQTVQTKTERIYTRLESRYRDEDRADNIASVD